MYVYDSHRKWERNDNKWHHNNGGQRHSCDSHRKWERNDNKWHHNDGGQRHSCDGQHFHRWNADKWGTVSAKAHGLNNHTSR